MSDDAGARVIDLDIAELNAAGDGVGAAGRLRIAVPFTIPGERVRVRLDPGRDGRVFPAILEILRASPHRVRPKCSHFGPKAVPGLGPCGGCAWQHIAYPEQLRLKRTLVDRLVGATVAGAPSVSETIAATPLDNPWGYRNKVHFVFGNLRFGDRRRDTTLGMGHYARGSRRVIPIRECPVHDERGNAFAFRARDTYAAAGVNAAGAAGGVLRSLAVRVGCHTSEMMATVVVLNDSDRRLRTATRKLLEEAPPTSAHLNIHPRDDAFVFGERTRRLLGPERMREQAAGVSFLMSPTTFFQTHVRAAEVLVGLVLATVPPGSRVIDLYAGAGLFSIPLALAGHSVTAVEENREAVADGEAALRLNGEAGRRCRFVARRAETALAALRGADVVVLDPPRDGCTPAVLRGVFEGLRPPRAIYVSCNPETLATDLRPICDSGYLIRSLQPVDMFPHTAHVETVAVLDRVRPA
jgi:23S rRNA (uracil1939-C5)-methyltransferase